MIRQAIVWEKLFAKDLSDKRLSSEKYEGLLKFNKKKTTMSIKKWPTKP